MDTEMKINKNRALNLKNMYIMLIKAEKVNLLGGYIKKRNKKNHAFYVYFGQK